MSNSEIILVRPAPEHEAAAAEYVAEHSADGSHINGSGGLAHASNYSLWLKQLERDENISVSITAIVPSSTFFAVRICDGRIVGMTNIRHLLNNELLHGAGHIGYGVRPSERRKGYASEYILPLALEYCREMGIHRVLVSCNRNNTGSARTIQKNGGVLENEVFENDGTILQRYWIEIK